jgi:hypothetical protein
VNAVICNWCGEPMRGIQPDDRPNHRPGLAWVCDRCGYSTAPGRIVPPAWREVGSTRSSSREVPARPLSLLVEDRNHDAGSQDVLSEEETFPEPTLTNEVVESVLHRTRCAVFALPSEAATSARLRPWSRGLGSDSAPGEIRRWRHVELTYVGPELASCECTFVVRSEQPFWFPLPPPMRLSDAVALLEGGLLLAERTVAGLRDGAAYRRHLNVEALQQAPSEITEIVHQSGETVRWEVRSIAAPFGLCYASASVDGTDVSAALAESAGETFAWLLSHLVRLRPSTPEVTALEDALRSARTYFETRFST